MTDHLRRHAGQDGVVREVAPHHGTGADHGVPSQPGAGQDDGSGTEPRTGSDLNRVLGRPLLTHGQLGVGVDVVLVGDVAARSGHHVVTDHHGAVGHEVAGPTD